MLGVIGMYTMTLTPGSVVKVWSKRYHFWHKGMVDSPDPLTGEQQVIHSDKGNFVRTTSLTEFAAGEMVIFSGCRRRGNSRTPRSRGCTVWMGSPMTALAESPTA